MARAVFYCASDAKNVLGVVGLLNSLRLQGHEEELIVLDAGLGDGDRELLEPHARVVSHGEDAGPFFRKYALPRTDAAVHVIFDADVLVTRPLGELIDIAATGKVVAFADGLVNRFHPEWGRLLGLGQLEPRPYVNAGLLMVPDIALPLLGAVLKRESAVDFSQSVYRGGPSDAPFLYCDQDVLNAVLAAPGSPEVLVLEHRLAPHPPFEDLAVIDEQRLRCRYSDGVEPYLLHHVLAKPWSAHTSTNTYSRFLRRLLLGPGVDLQLLPNQVPVRLRGGGAAAAARLNAHVRASIRAQRGRLGLRRRLLWALAGRAPAS
jgi:hypothetical protein